MIIYKKEPIPILMKNIIMLDDESTQGVVYISKGTYDQCISLNVRFDGNVVSLHKFIKKDEDYTRVDGFLKSMNFFKSNAPSPINMLAPFLTLLYNNANMKWDSYTMEDLYGLFHIMSQIIDFNAVSLVNAEIRASVNIPTSILLSYKSNWDELCSTLKDYTVLSYRRKDIVTEEFDEDDDEVVEVKHNKKTNKKVTNTKVKQKEEQKVEDEEDEEDDESNTVSLDLFANAFASTLQMVEEDKKNELEKSKEKENTASSDTSKNEVKSEQTNERVTPVTNKKEAEEIRDILNDYSGF